MSKEIEPANIPQRVEALEKQVTLEAQVEETIK
jgi:hypothetical protein